MDKLICKIEPNTKVLDVKFETEEMDRSHKNELNEHLNIKHLDKKPMIKIKDDMEFQTGMAVLEKKEKKYSMKNTRLNVRITCNFKLEWLC